MSHENNPETVREKVRTGYGQIAKTGGSCCGGGVSCCGSSPEASKDLAKHIGYSVEELAALPDGANMGLSCGNPNALAALKPGEVVLDLGSGGGFDVFIAGRKVGSTGRALGVDMTSEMLAKARKNIAGYRELTGLDNVEFRLGEIEHLPVADASVDVVISNCVINLSPDKAQVWKEIARVLKPGGRVAVSDLALLKPLPTAIVETVEALIGCVAGAVLVSDTERMAKDAGLVNIELKAKSNYIEGMVDWQDPLYQKITEALPPGQKPADFITSLEITARKPGSSGLPAAASQVSQQPEQASCCAAGCGCETTQSQGKVRFIIGTLVLAAAAIMVVRAAIRNGEKPKASAEFALPTAGVAAATNSSAESAQQNIGTTIGAFSELNTFATKTDAVFVYLPGKESASTNLPAAPINAAVRTIEAQGIKCGLFTLKAGSPDYSELSAQMSLPGVLAMVKGRGMTPISGEITETKLVQGYVSASQAGGCCPGGSASGCK